jgi:hypothetical protein
MGRVHNCCSVLQKAESHTDTPSKGVLMPVELISLDEASCRLEESGISGRAFAEILVKSEPLLLGIFPSHTVRGRIGLSRVTTFRAEAENIAVADNVRWTDIKLDWRELRAAFETRGHKVDRSCFTYITPALMERARQPSRKRRFLGDPRPPMPLPRAVSAAAQPARRARPEWFENAVFTGAVPASGQPPRGRRGPKSGKRENTAAAIRKDLEDKILTVTALRAMPEEQLAGRYSVSRDTARKARNDALQ